MPNHTLASRRRFVKIGSASIVAIPLLALTGRSFAATNAAMRDCAQVPGQAQRRQGVRRLHAVRSWQDARRPGGCKLMPGDTEISPKGYCTAWVAKPK